MTEPARGRRGRGVLRAPVGSGGGTATPALHATRRGTDRALLGDGDPCRAGEGRDARACGCRGLGGRCGRGGHSRGSTRRGRCLRLTTGGGRRGRPGCRCYGRRASAPARTRETAWERAAAVGSAAGSASSAGAEAAVQVRAPAARPAKVERAAGPAAAKVREAAVASSAAGAQAATSAEAESVEAAPGAAAWSRSEAAGLRARASARRRLVRRVDRRLRRRGRQPSSWTRTRAYPLLRLDAFPVHNGRGPSKGAAGGGGVGRAAAGRRF